MKLLLLVIGIIICKRVIRTRPRLGSLILMAAGLYFIVMSLWQGHYAAQFVEGPEATGKVVEKRVEQDWTMDYIVTVSWRGADGIEHRHDIKTMADFFGAYEIGKPVELALSQKSPDLAVMKSDLVYAHSFGPIFFTPMMYVGISILIISAVVFIFAFQILDYYSAKSFQNGSSLARRSKKWRWDDEP